MPESKDIAILCESFYRLIEEIALSRHAGIHKAQASSSRGYCPERRKSLSIVYNMYHAHAQDSPNPEGGLPEERAARRWLAFASFICFVIQYESDATVALMPIPSESPSEPKALLRLESRGRSTPSGPHSDERGSKSITTPAQPAPRSSLARSPEPASP